MSAHGVLFSLAAGIATLYVGLWAAERTNDGPWLGWGLALLVFAGCLLLDAGV